MSENVNKNVTWTKSKGQNHQKYAINSKTWISYEDHNDIAAKVMGIKFTFKFNITLYFQAKFVFDKNLAGLMFFTLNAEDTFGHHCNLRYPLLDTASKAFNN